eukprot:scaffold71777_cov60-Phaeocystis_antarctica.AAC.2
MAPSCSRSSRATPPICVEVWNARPYIPTTQLNLTVSAYWMAAACEKFGAARNFGSRRQSVRSQCGPADFAQTCAIRSARRSAVRPQRDRCCSLADRSVCDTRPRPAFSSFARHAGSDAGGIHGVVCGPHLVRLG